MSPCLYQEEKGNPKPLETLSKEKAVKIYVTNNRAFPGHCPHNWPSPHPFFGFSEYEDGISA